MTTLETQHHSGFDCGRCRTRCDGRSKLAYVFDDDVQKSEAVEASLAARLSSQLGVDVVKTAAQAHGLPDLEVACGGQLISRVEVKVQGRAFMAVQRLLPYAGLRPYETVALNLSDLQRYIELYQRERVPLFLVWHVRRPCLGEGYWGAPITALERLWRRYGERRQFRRKSAPSDYVDGQHKGVVVNYHFSLNELESLDEVQLAIQRLVRDRR
jgi:hypothetical protein